MQERDQAHRLKQRIVALEARVARTTQRFSRESNVKRFPPRATGRQDIVPVTVDLGATSGAVSWTQVSAVPYAPMSARSLIASISVNMTAFYMSAPTFSVRSGYDTGAGFVAARADAEQTTVVEVPLDFGTFAFQTVGNVEFTMTAIGFIV